jgi:LmbE family N-acetylglucosaminyl deacetylase
MAIATPKVEIGSNYLILSPHLDDAVLSCGALLTALADHSNVTVVTVFTEGAGPPHTRAAESFLGRCNATSVEQLYAERRREDRDILASLGVKAVNLGFCDALFRRREGRPAWSVLGRGLPELIHRYPTYRFDIAKGRISRGDRVLIEQVEASLLEIIARHTPELVFCPLGVGRHVDHLIVRGIVTSHLSEVVYYSEFPYVMTEDSQTKFRRRRGLEPWVWDRMLHIKRNLIGAYRTQVHGLFPGGVIPVIPEVYYVPRSGVPALRRWSS